MNVPETLYTQYAKDAINAFEKKGTALHESVVSFAKNASFNPQQTRRLVERVNTMTHLHYMDKKASQRDDDRYVIFDTVDPDEVLKAVGHKAPTYKTKEKTAAHKGYADEVFYDLPNEHKQLTKTASTVPPLLSAEEMRAVEDPVFNPHNVYKYASRTLKTAEELEVRTLEKLEEYKGALYKLAFMMNRTSYTDVQTFVKDAAVRDKKECRILLSSLTEFCKLSNHDMPTFPGTDELEQHVFMKETPLLEQFSRVKKARLDALTHAEGLKEIQEGLQILQSSPGLRR